MSVVRSIEEVGPCRLKVTIEVPSPAVEAELGRVVQDYRKHAHLPGFRKGKVPAGVIRKRYRREIEKDLIERLLPRYWKQAQAEKGLDPLMPPMLDEPELVDGEPLTVVMSVETRPEIALGEVHDYDLPEESTEVSDDELAEALADLRRNFATWETVDRAAAQGDLVVGTVLKDSDDDGETEVEAQPLHYEIGGKNGDEELSLALTGASAGQSVEHTTTQGEGDEAETVRWTVSVSEVKEQNLPELDDELASKVGEFETVSELEGAVGENLEARKKDDLRRRRQKALLDQLVERHPLTLPEGVVQQEAERLVQEYAEHMSRQGVDLENAGIDWGSMLDDIRPQAERRVHERLLLDAVAKKDGIRLDEAEFERFLGAAAAQQGLSSLALRQRLSENGQIDGLRGQMLRDQTLSQLLGEREASDDEGTETDDDNDNA
ncbi:MAG: trigger factor [Acidobacteriota bacterium]